MENALNDYISREIVQDPALLPLSNETSLLFPWERFGIMVGDADLLTENFDG